MKAIKNILLITLIVYGLGMTVFANLKANEAEKLKQLAEEHQAMAVQAAADARMAEAEAIIQLAKARERKALLVTELEKCK